LGDFLALPVPNKNSDPSWFGFPIRVKQNSPIDRNQIVKLLNKKNIGTRFLFGGNLIRQPFFKHINYRISGKLENSDVIMNNVFWIGVQPNLSKEMIKFTISEIKSIFK
jgi:CDP-6-deoxy-D-xylo-4-hexulose-3-dehydrase